ncbi:hypothetical protein LCGC14_1160220 [marine sediment metagenome]|uniref:N-acetyltransferase domain-containing protein n=1 Tax=marine sediment metagenome TaxID=412755 RepID=A0A0F9PB57_9ZZZZ
MNFRAATQEDLDYVRENPFEGAVKNTLYSEVPDSNTYAVVYEGSLVAVGGVQVFWPGRGSFWLILTADCKKEGIHGLRALYAIREKIEELSKINNLHRAEAAVRTEFSRAIAMIEALGFKREALMKQYWPDKGDAYLYSKAIR